MIWSLTRPGARLAAAAVFAALVALNACAPTPRLTIENPGALPEAGDQLTVTIWNVGYGALGDDADFMADGGQSFRASGRDRIETNLAAITARLARSNSDIHMLQEVAGPGLMTRGVDVRGAVSGAFPDHWTAASASVKTRFVPGPLAFDHGLFTASRLAVESADLVEITREPGRMGGVLKRAYHVQITRLAGTGRWSVINAHLSAFDDGEVRMRQLADVLAVATGEYDRGRRVVIGGDFNQRLAPTDFAYTTTQEDLFWLRDFPVDQLPPGWRVVADPGTPSVRTLERAYAPGENYTAVIDGFIVSPNIQVISVEGRNTGFVPADHQPVVLIVAAD
jgi:endonuclease/exonuclease/phosphatase family metal-dependent hydrolase